MKKKDNNKTVDRSRLTLLGGLAAGAAGGGCVTDGEVDPFGEKLKEKRRRERRFDRWRHGSQSYPSGQDQGGDGGGGH